MNFILLIILVVCLYRIRFSGVGFYDDYLSKASTTCVNGVFVFFVFLRHFGEYIEYAPYDKLFSYVAQHILQLLVVTFLFYSGYGIMCSIRKKGMDYVKAMPYHRALKVWMHFALAVLLFYCVDLLCGKKFPLSRVLLSFVGWEAIGNSNWYIFYVVITYLVTFVAFLIADKLTKKRRDILAVCLITLCSVCYMLILHPLKGKYWYNTAISFPIGMFYCLFEDKIRKIIQKNNLIYWLTSAVALVYFYFCYQRRESFLYYQCCVIGFIALILLGTMKFRVNNSILLWLGKYTFEIYILQRIPMLVLKGRIANNCLYFGVCFVLTLLIAVLFRKITDAIDAKIYG